MGSKIIYKRDVNNRRKTVFLDRDGVINKKPAEHEYVYKIEDFAFNRGIFSFVKRANKLGYRIIVITNQRGISRGFYTHSDFENLSNYMFNRFCKNGGFIDAIYYCPHGIDDECNCRKPEPGLFFDAIVDFSVNASLSIMIGDTKHDIDAAKSAGITRTYLINSDILCSLKDIVL